MSAPATPVVSENPVCVPSFFRCHCWETSGFVPAAPAMVKPASVEQVTVTLVTATPGIDPPPLTTAQVWFEGREVAMTLKIAPAVTSAVKLKGPSAPMALVSGEVPLLVSCNTSPAPVVPATVPLTFDIGGGLLLPPPPPQLAIRHAAAAARKALPMVVI